VTRYIRMAPSSEFDCTAKRNVENVCVNGMCKNDLNGEAGKAE
jgi:hypothetical protein